MTRSKFYTPYPWAFYSRKLCAKIENPKFSGVLTADQTKGMRLVIGREGAVSTGNAITFYWLVDESDGVIADVKFQAFGASALIGAAEVACELMVGKNYDQARRISTELIDKQVRDRPEVTAFPKETSPHLNLVLGAIDHTADQCTAIPLAINYVAPPAPMDIGEILEGGYPGWENLSQGQKIALIEEIIARDIRPYIELDAGGIQVLDLINGNEVLIAYQGSCTSCFSATGTTLSYIQQVLRGKVHPSLVVIPDLSNFH